MNQAVASIPAEPRGEDKEAQENVPANETNADRFKRVATRRTNAALKQIHLLGNCADRGSYEYNEEQVRSMMTSLENAITSLHERFRNSGNSGAPTVEL